MQYSLPRGIHRPKATLVSIAGIAIITLSYFLATGAVGLSGGRSGVSNNAPDSPVHVLSASQAAVSFNATNQSPVANVCGAGQNCTVPAIGTPILITAGVNTSTSSGQGNTSGATGARPVGPTPSSWSGSTSYKNAAYWTSAYNFYPTALWVSVTTPSSAPRWNDRYSVILSAYDNLGNYDQLGFASCYSSATGCQSGNDAWTVDWEQGTAASCGQQFGNNLNWVAAYLTPNTQYTFEMTFSGNTLYYYVIQGGIGGTQVWNTSVSDSAGGWSLSGTNGNSGEFYTCGGATYIDFSAWEEVYSITSTMSYPQWNFNFTNLTALIGGVARLTSMPGGYWNGPSATPSPFVGTTENFGSTVEVINELQSISFASNTFYISKGSGFTVHGRLLNPGTLAWCSAHTCTTNAFPCSWPSGWGGSCTFPSAAPGSLIYTATSPSGASSGIYYMGWYVELSGTGISPTEYTTYVFYVCVT